MSDYTEGEIEYRSAGGYEEADPSRLDILVEAHQRPPAADSPSAQIHERWAARQAEQRPDDAG